MDYSVENWCSDENDRTQRFHTFCSGNVDLSVDGRVAFRVASFRGLCFSLNPLKPDFPFVVQIRRVEHGWTGHLRLGLTTVDPSTSPDLNSSEFNAETFLVPLPRKANSPSGFPMETNAIFGVYFKSVAAGAVRPFALINDDHLPLRDEPIQFTSGKAIYAVVDLFGVTKVAEVIPIKRSVPRLLSLCERLICRIFHGVPTTLPLPKTVRQSIYMRDSASSVVVA